MNWKSSQSLVWLGALDCNSLFTPDVGVGVSSEGMPLAAALSMEELFKHWTVYLAEGVEAAAAVVIAAATVEAVIRSAGVLLRLNRYAEAEAKEHIRLQMGRWLALALEFELAADILRTAVAPTWSEIGQLAAIVVLRTVLNFFLQREIDQAAAREAMPSVKNKESLKGGATLLKPG